MSSYQTNLKQWGATGAEYPDGYKYEELTPPVDVWDNFLINNLINDTKHLIGLTNSRVESDYGTSKPSPENAHLFINTSSGELFWYDAASSAWAEALDKTGDSMTGLLTAKAGVETGGSISSDTGTTIYDYQSDELQAGILDNNSVTVNTGTGLVGGGSVTLGSSVSVSLDGTSLNGDGFSADQVDGQDWADIKTWVNNNSDVPNADYADNSGAVEGRNFQDIKNWVNGNADVPNADFADSAGAVEGAGFQDIKDWVNNNADVPNADHADEASSFETGTSYPSNPTSGQVIFRTDKT